MGKHIFTITIILFSAMLSIGQENDQEFIDSVFTHINEGPSTFRLKMLKNCKNAIIIAEQDIEDNELHILIVGGIAPTIFSTDTIFENKYQVKYHDFGDLSAKSECMYNYNKTIFEYLTKMYGKQWQKEIRKDVYGLRKWKKNK